MPAAMLVTMLCGPVLTHAGAETLTAHPVVAEVHRHDDLVDVLDAAMIPL